VGGSGAALVLVGRWIEAEERARMVGKALPSRHRKDAVAASLERDPSTRLAYLAIGVFAFDLYTFGPALALLRRELHFSYAMVGINSGAWAAGTIAASIGFRRAVGLVGRRQVFWWSALALGAGTIVFALSYGVGLSLLGALLMGSGGTLLLTAAQAILLDHHGQRRGGRPLSRPTSAQRVCGGRSVAPRRLGRYGGYLASRHGCPGDRRGGGLVGLSRRQVA